MRRAPYVALLAAAPACALIFDTTRLETGADAGVVEGGL